MPVARHASPPTNLAVLVYSTPTGSFTAKFGGDTSMGEPPAQLDGADVLCWATSNRGGFYQLVGSDPPVMVAGMAVARYADGGPVYLFKCNAAWHVIQDWDCG